jgi:hypothetical protein
VSLFLAIATTLLRRYKPWAETNPILAAGTKRKAGWLLGQSVKQAGCWDKAQSRLAAGTKRKAGWLLGQSAKHAGCWDKA